MTLLNDFFEITETFSNESAFTVAIRLFPGHIIYAGHFPGHPITPGVIQLQIVHELLEKHFGKRIHLITIDDCKFMKIVNPEEEPHVHLSVAYEVNGSVVRVRAAGKRAAELFLKLKGTYKLETDRHIPD